MSFKTATCIFVRKRFPHFSACQDLELMHKNWWLFFCKVLCKKAVDRNFDQRNKTCNFEGKRVSTSSNVKTYCSFWYAGITEWGLLAKIIVFCQTKVDLFFFGSWGTRIVCKNDGKKQKKISQKSENSKNLKNQIQRNVLVV